MWGSQDDAMPVAVIDVGSNTVRLLVVERGETLFTVREPIGLGAAVEQDGRIPPAKLDETADVVSAFAAAARDAGAERLEILITSPGRQAANGEDLLELLALAAAAPARIVSAQEEGRLAFVGALAGADLPARRSVAVIDVGGGSAQVVVGARVRGPEWISSLDIGSLRLTTRMLGDDPPGRAAVARARAEIEQMLDGVDIPTPQSGIAVGGSARSLRRIVGSRLDANSLAEATSLLAETSQKDLIARFELPPHRARTLAAGAVIFSALQDRLGTSLKVSRTGLREGALLELAARKLAA
jgi:exopolyphosphatase/guanosine-5'-triphosphate,3'-diphosphate pyrophosphatase